ncbi:MAG: thiolase family protein [Vicinamibacteria bacterium]|nr:thiolase family protein [Vicinamibacteria bacterium]
MARGASVSVYLVSPLRTPIGRYGGGLSSLSAADLGVHAVKAVLDRTGVDPASVTEALMGCARQAGGGPNVARQISFRAGLGESVPAMTINMACGSGLKAIELAFKAVRDGDAQAVVAGGTESMSRVPYFLNTARWGVKMGAQEVVDGMYKDGFACPLADMLMGETAERLAEIHSLSREEQDEFALRSQQRAGVAQVEGRFDSQIVPVDVRQGKATVTIAKDEHPRPDSSIEALRKLAPVFKKTGGTVTAGNSSGITDGAAAALVCSESKLKELKVQPMARILGVAASGVDPKIMGIGVVPATRTLLNRLGMRLDDFSLIEANEAFAAQVLACDRELRFDHEKLNVNGGSIALGHPIGCTGTRIVVTLVHEMVRRKVRYGLATLCISGGMGLAAAFELV